MTIEQQLAAGIRFLDIRVRNAGDQFLIFHGDVYQRQNFGEVLSTVRSFLAANDKETVVMSIKQDKDADKATLGFEERFDKYATDKNLWYLGDTVPLLDQVRGKIVLLRRFDAISIKGINAEPALWKDDDDFSIPDPSSTVKVGKISQMLRIQDYYGMDKFPTKCTAMPTMFKTSLADTRAETLYINFASISGPPNPRGAAAAINYGLSSQLDIQPRGRYGIVPLDFPSSDLIEKFIATNF